jgi:hypothetical protein
MQIDGQQIEIEPEDQRMQDDQENDDEEMEIPDGLEGDENQ